MSSTAPRQIRRKNCFNSSKFGAKLHFSAAMNSFQLYLQLGFEHIVSLSAIDHLLFLLLLINGLSFTNFRLLIFLITSFTIGHSITLALSALNMVTLDAQLIEFLIPLTIAITAIFNVMIKASKPIAGKLKMVVVGFFGLIHGMGFSNYLKVLLDGSESVVWPLFGFNVGVELGQLAVVLFCLTIFWLLDKFGWIKTQQSTLFINGVGLGAALIIMKGAFYW